MQNNKTVFISNLTPSTSYGLNLFWALNNVNKNIIAYAEKEIKYEVQNSFEPGVINKVWNKSYKYIFQIIKQLNKDKPKIVHIQHELNIYGSTLSVLLFPLLLLIIRLKKIKLVLTVHALPTLKQIDKDFVLTFKNKSNLHPVVLKIFFFFYYKIISMLANKIIVHTNLIANNYSSIYKANKNKIHVIPIGCHDLTNYSPNYKPYFFYMGYLVNRKGLQTVIDGFADFIKNNPNNPFEFKIAGSAIKGQEFARNQILEVVNFYDDEIRNKIHILGFINQQQVDEHFKSAYAVVVPSKVNIAASGPLSWALSYGKCIIASDVNNLREEIDHNKDGILIQNHYKDWSNTFNKIASNFDLVKSLEENAKLKAKQRNWHNIAKMHYKIYQSII